MVKEKSVQGGGLVPVILGEDHEPEQRGWREKGNTVDSIQSGHPWDQQTGLIIGVDTFQEFTHIFSHTCRCKLLLLFDIGKSPIKIKIQSQFECL